MASTEEELLALELYHCYHCGLDSTTNSFRYFDNNKTDQPRCQCEHCHKFFTLGWYGRPQGKTYAKKRNEDPPELKSLSRQCRHCGVADNAPFKYYNNRNTSQPRFKCLSCGKQFQMRLLGIGEEWHLVHTSSQRRSVACRRKQGVSEPFSNASSSSEEEIYQPSDGSFMPVSCDPLMSLEPSARLFSETSDEDAEYSDFLEAEVAKGENPEANLISWIGNGDDGNLPLSLNGGDSEFLAFLETELLAEEDNVAPNGDAFPSTANVDNALPPAWSNEDALSMDYIEAGVRDNDAPDANMVCDNLAEMVSESTCNNAEVMYGTLIAS